MFKKQYTSFLLDKLHFGRRNELSPLFFLKDCKHSTLSFEEVVTLPAEKNSDRNVNPSNLNTAIVIHGLLGSGRNWRTPAKIIGENAVSMNSQLSASGWRLVLVNLRNHGPTSELQGFPPPHNISSAANDVLNLVESMNWSKTKVVIGHSLGGKVALEYARLTSQSSSNRNVAAPNQLWILDSVPSIIESSLPNDVDRVINALKKFPDPIPSRRWLLEELSKLGFSSQLSEWLASNLKKVDASNESMKFTFDVHGAFDMYHSFKNTCFMQFLRNPPPEMRLDLVKAERSDRWPSDVADELQLLSQQQPVRGLKGSIGFHVLPKAGHWLHVDNLQGLVKMISPSLTRIAHSP